MIDRSLAVRDGGAAASFIDVAYESLLVDPIAEVRRIYAHAGRVLTSAAEEAMRTVVDQDKQHRYGRHVYRTRDFGLSPALIEETFADYRARFQIRREKLERESIGAGGKGDRALGFQNPIAATVTGVVDLLRTHGALEPVPADLRLDGKTAVVTGATSGLGRAVAIDLARRGARVLLPSRSGIPEAGEAIAREAGQGQVEMLPVDLADLDSISALADTLALRHETVDLLICNAGVMPARGAQSRQGYELMFAVHYLGNHLLTRKLLMSGVIPNDVYAKNGRKGTAIPRIVLVSSETHRSPKEIDFAHFGAPFPYGVTDGVAWYGKSKLALTTFGCELARHLVHEGAPSVGVHVLCPGPVDSKLAREAPAFMKPLLGPVMKTFFRSPEAAAAPVIYLGTAPELAGDTGWYLHLMQRKEPSSAASDVEAGKRLWEMGEGAIDAWPR
jgi:NAD(P)-dependent dehydrogenase (short-subunit alcohol dehydrogenase family)